VSSANSLRDLLRHAFEEARRKGIYLRTRSDGRLFNLARLRAKTKVREALIRDMRFADDAAVATHTQRELQSLMDQDGIVQCLCHQHTAIR